MEKPHRLYCLSLEAATTPPESGQTTCISNAWWVVHPEKGIVLYRWGKRSTCSPQHNRDQAVTEMIQKNIYPWAEVRQLPMVFLRQDGEGSFLLPAEARQIELAPA